MVKAEIRDALHKKSSIPVIPGKSNSKIGNTAMDWCLYKYRHLLVYYEVHELYIEAARREKRFKNWPRQWKINLIEGFNPEWHDLYEEICQ